MSDYPMLISNKLHSFRNFLIQIYSFYGRFLLNLLTFVHSNHVFMGRKQEYKETNLEFLKELSSQEGVYALPCGIYYKVLETGTGTVFPNVRSIVTVHYKGSLINGRVFDNSYERNCPEAFRLCDVIDGWQLALQRMRAGDKWIIYIPYTMGYGTRASGPIPAFSTLVFEVELLGVA